jgi:2'-5' RNA ligase
VTDRPFVPNHRDRRGFVPGNQPRLFVGAPIPQAVAASVGALIERVASAMGPDGRSVRWVQMDGLHVTLRFLGPTPPDRVGSVEAAVDEAAHLLEGPFEVRLGGAGGFPDVTRPRALWLGIRAGAGDLGRLSDGLASALAARGWELEARPFRPHLTIARTDGVHAGADAGQRLIAAASDLDLPFTVDRVILYRSHLGHGPARYEVVHEAGFG